ncbi:alcohol dehydrogenase, partial [Clostridium beijerinckii]|nr:alcohol dehydrogenase [Clostridium beijerinckii]
MLDKYNLKMPHAVYSGENSLENIKTILLENKVNKLAVFT